ncbi:hypothetical protein QMO46_16280 [Microbacterium barkeri]|uniref:hypothetical protein n=1 Tax=Microbacterium barkeri TaxID=33917 RepID=UPI0024AF9E45|nr:hypothetical protein [Microbacterium barkeri]MDI6945045.1 hypothetical protein [Microbacterium barkeri]
MSTPAPASGEALEPPMLSNASARGAIAARASRRPATIVVPRAIPAVVSAPMRRVRGSCVGRSDGRTAAGAAGAAPSGDAACGGSGGPG